MAKLFGFSIKDSEGEDKNKNIVSPVPPNQEDGVDYYLSSGFYGQYVDLEGVFKTEFDIFFYPVLYLSGYDKRSVGEGAPPGTRIVTCRRVHVGEVPPRWDVS